MKTEKYNCPSYYDDEVKQIVDCTCERCDLHDNIDESVEQIKSWNKYGESKVPYTVIILIAVCIGVICAMILTNTPSSVN